MELHIHLQFLAKECQVLQRKRRRAADLLGIADSGTIETDRPLGELGLDSLRAVQFRDELMRSTGLDLPIQLLFDFPTIDALAGHILEELMSRTEGATNQNTETEPRPPSADLRAQAATMSESAIVDRIANIRRGL